MSDPWTGGRVPPRRREAHFGDRVIACFAERPPDLWTMFSNACRARPDAEALVAGQARMTYRQCDAAIQATAAGLAAHGIAAGDRVALLLSNRAEFFLGYLALQRLAAIAVPIGTREQADGVGYVLSQCAARAIVFDDEFAARVPGSIGLLRIACESPGHPQTPDALRFESLARTTGAPPPLARIDDESTATLLYTSGTTGRPKGAMLTHLGIVHSALHFRHCLGLPEGTRALLAVPASHVTGLVAIMLTAVACGGTTVMMSAFSARTFLEQAAQERIDYTLMVPAMYQLCLLREDFAAHDLSAWRVGGFGGAPMPVATIDAIASRLPALRLVNAYGATETTSPATIMPSGLAREQADSVGLPVPCGAIAVVDDAGREVPVGEVGELWISGPMVVSGYWDNPQANAQEFTSGWWHSGDLGSVDAHGFVRVFDRKKDMINRGGYKIFSVEVENRLMAMAGIVEAAVVGVPCPVLGERVQAFVVASDAALREHDLQQWCAAHLSDYKVPERIHFHDQPLPRNANGKLLKRVLRERLHRLQAQEPAPGPA